MVHSSCCFVSLLRLASFVAFVRSVGGTIRTCASRDHIGTLTTPKTGVIRGITLKLVNPTSWGPPNTNEFNVWIARDKKVTQLTQYMYPREGITSGWRAGSSHLLYKLDGFSTTSSQLNLTEPRYRVQQGETLRVYQNNTNITICVDAEFLYLSQPIHPDASIQMAMTVTPSVTEEIQLRLCQFVLRDFKKYLTPQIKSSVCDETCFINGRLLGRRRLHDTTVEVTVIFIINVDDASEATRNISQHSSNLTSDIESFLNNTFGMGVNVSNITAWIGEMGESPNTSASPKISPRQQVSGDVTKWIVQWAWVVIICIGLLLAGCILFALVWTRREKSHPTPTLNMVQFPSNTASEQPTDGSEVLSSSQRRIYEAILANPPVPECPRSPSEQIDEIPMEVSMPMTTSSRRLTFSINSTRVGASPKGDDDGLVILSGFDDIVLDESLTAETAMSVPMSMRSYTRRQTATSGIGVSHTCQELVDLEETSTYPLESSGFSQH